MGNSALDLAEHLYAGCLSDEGKPVEGKLSGTTKECHGRSG